MIEAMVKSERGSARDACNAFGKANVLRILVGLSEGNSVLPTTSVKAWFSEACSDSNLVARYLIEEAFDRALSLEIVARAVAPDFVPNDFGDDPWLTACRRTKTSEIPLYLAAFLLTRAFGRRTHNFGELVQITFDKVYAATERTTIPDDAWELLDNRLARNYFWPSWDRCARIRHTIVDELVSRELNYFTFLQITSRDDIFENLVEIAASSYSGQRYLKSVRTQIFQDANNFERLRIVKKAIW